MVKYLLCDTVTVFDALVIEMYFRPFYSCEMCISIFKVRLLAYSGRVLGRIGKCLIVIFVSNSARLKWKYKRTKQKEQAQQRAFKQEFYLWILVIQIVVSVSCVTRCFTVFILI